MRSYLSCGIGCLVMLAIGCSSRSSEPVLAPADGVVTFQGKPLVGARVTFTPEKGALALGVTDTEGKFQMATGSRKGVIVGPVGVSISQKSDDSQQLDPALSRQAKTPEEAQAYLKKAGEMQAQMAKNPPKKVESQVPEKYTKASTSGLTYTIKPNGNDNHFKIDLE